MSKNQLLAAACTLAAAGVASAQSYILMDVGSLGGVKTEAFDINNAGQIVGWGKTAAAANRAFITQPNTPVNSATDLIPLMTGGTSNFAYAVNATGGVAGDGNSSSGDRAFRYAGGTVTQINPSKGNWTYGADINASGQLVGSTSIVGNNTQPMLYSGGTAYALGTLGGSNGYATAINDAGVIVGSTDVSGGGMLIYNRGFRWTPSTPNGTAGTMVDIGSLGGNYVYPFDIANDGDVVGGSTTLNDATYEAFFLASGSSTMMSLGTLGGASSEAQAINRLNQIVGYADTAGGDAHAFLYDGGVMTDLNTLMPAGSGWTLTGARGINDLGQIVGVGRNSLNEVRGFLLTPASTWAKDSDGVWSTTTNWVGDVPNAAAAPANFTGAITAARTVTLETPKTVGKITFHNPASYTLTGAALTVTGADSGVLVRSGDHIINTPTTFTAAGAIELKNGTRLTFGGGLSGTVSAITLGTDATLDVGSGRLAVDYDAASPVADIQAAVNQARAGGTWTGEGITSALLSTAPDGRHAIGVADTGDVVRVGFTLLGDANVDGTVGFTDLLSLAKAYNSAGVWANGDSNFDGQVNFTDLLALAKNYGGSALDGSGIVMNAALHAQFDSDWAAALAAVPEPGVASLLLVGGMLARRRRA